MEEVVTFSSSMQMAASHRPSSNDMADWFSCLDRSVTSSPV